MRCSAKNSLSLYAPTVRVSPGSGKLRGASTPVTTTSPDGASASFIVCHSSFRHHVLKGDTQAELHLAHGLGSGNGSKGSGRQWIGWRGSVGSIQIDHVEDVDSFASELNAPTLADLEGAKDRQIDVPVGRLIQEVPGRVSVR